ncbi:MAG: hypothetical protein ACTSPR_01235 [Candidatus Thorarchaeota archaeon]
MDNVPPEKDLESMREELKNLKIEHIREMNEWQDESIQALAEATKQHEKVLAEAVKQQKRDTRNMMSELLEEMGEHRAWYRIHLRDLRNAPQSAQKNRDRADNLRKNLTEVISRMTRNEEDEDISDEEMQEKDEADSDMNLEAARAAVRSLEESIKHFDRIHRELSLKLETFESRAFIARVGAFVGGFLILVGAMTLTGGMFLALAGGEIPLISPAAYEFFNYVLVFLGVILIVSGFLHQV